MKKPAILIALAGIVLFAAGAGADVTPASVFTDNAVLQMGAAIPVWGTADAGESVTVTFAGQQHTVTADASGQFRVDLAAIASAAEGSDLTLAGKNTVVLHNIAVGEVWVCSGQSNMELPVTRSKNSADEIKAADYPDIRSFTVARACTPAPAQSVGGKWVVCSPATVGKFSAAAYYFARELNQKMKVPVGLIHSSWGGTPIQFWMTPETAPPQQGKTPPSSTRPGALHPSNGQLYNAMISPLIPYAIRGALWYQGEANEGDPIGYRTFLPTMIQTWREKWGQGDFPFLIVQLPNFRARADSPASTGWTLIREAEQMATTKQPATFVTVNIDIGEEKNIHPADKQTVGHRLAAVALAKVYGQPVVWTGPTVESVKYDANTAAITFANIGGGLAAHGDSLTGFWLADDARQWRKATAAIHDDQVVLQADGLSNPTAVRYAWGNNPECDLYNQEGFPAAPFRTDDWNDLPAATRPSR